MSAGADMAADPGRHIAVCIPTCRRPRMLADCLAAVARLISPGGCIVSVVIADNDAGESARAQVEGLRPTFPWPLHYVVEPERGLAAVRNRLLHAALDLKADWIAFLDDDETPAPDWLGALYRTAREHQADVVTGPLVPIRNPAD
jgi:succinoglycan biosynthesis protein ExoM